ncbi:cell division protein Cdc14 [Dichotomopilus funicola]|uniref:Cell division protein Cdc14 n=1 Tax=Dichotomopilus funicola TaxID=1934379 RepID=A0AAN6ZPA2_9PEZI|nr:cell division protein Cdc14 [Dichotomopilus funicola]
MESLLSLAFDNLSSFDGGKIKKGLKQVEGLLAQICLSPPNNPTPGSPRKNSHPSDRDREQEQNPPRKHLSDVSGDPAFREFFKLQEGFEWNIAQRLLTTLDWLVVRGGDGQYDLLIVNALDLIQGVLLLHPPSKGLFSRSVHMNLLLDLLEPINCPAIQSATLTTLVVALLDMPRNTRVFEQLDGLLTVTSLFKSRDTSREVKVRLTEFMYFYLTPETPVGGGRPVSAAGRNGQGKLGKALFSSSGDGKGGREGDAEDGVTVSVREKKGYVDRYLPGVVDELVKDLEVYKPFGGVLS